MLKEMIGFFQCALAKMKPLRITVTYAEW